MTSYIVRRLCLLVVTTVGASILVFSLVRFMPGSIVDLLAAESTDPGVTAVQIRHRFGLDRSPVVQYGHWVGGVLRGDLGHSFRTGKPISSELRATVPVSVELGILALSFSVLVAIPVGIVAALRRETWVDYLARGVAVWALATPSFWLGILLITWPSVWWGWSPPIQYVNFWDNPLTNLSQLALPVITVSLALSGSVMRLTRSTMLDIMSLDYVRTARAKGLPPRAVVSRHMLRNALIPIVTVVGLQAPVLIGGLVITETIFGIPGMGRYLIDALQNRDYQVVQAVVLMTVTFVLVLNLLVDLSYSVLDPRIRYA